MLKSKKKPHFSNETRSPEILIPWVEVTMKLVKPEPFAFKARRTGLSELIGFFFWLWSLAPHPCELIVSVSRSFSYRIPFFAPVWSIFPYPSRFPYTIPAGSPTPVDWLWFLRQKVGLFQILCLPSFQCFFFLWTPWTSDQWGDDTCMRAYELRKSGWHYVTQSIIGLLVDSFLF